ncbi:MAG TPA: hemolysin family protein [Chloroflexia bacterium]|nr:hemolysin family protein [Chloroflexia bacterium]
MGLSAVFVLVALNGFFVAAEFALVSVRRTRVEQLVAEGNAAAKTVHKAISNLDNYIAATQLGITLASLALGWVGEPALAHLVEPIFGFFLPGGVASPLSHTVAIAVSFILITTLHIVMGELAPKSVALQRTEGTALFVARPLELFRKIFRPFIWFMNAAGQLAVRLIGLDSADEHSKVHSVEELEMLVRESREAGYLDRDEEVLLRRVFDFGDKSARQVMIPRTEIVGVPEEATLEMLISLAADERYTRYPVYHESLDKILGVIHVKDLFGLVRKGFSPEQGFQTFKLSQIMRPVLTVPDTLHVADLLPQMRLRQVHMAVIIDEYGGTAGIVTLEDILEEIVGDVRDEFDTKESGVQAEYEAGPDGSTLISGLYLLQDAVERFNLTVDEEELDEYDTLGGYIQGRLGRIPKIGDEVVLENYALEVTEMDGLRVDRICLKPVSKDELGSQGAETETAKSA